MWSDPISRRLCFFSEVAESTVSPSAILRNGQRVTQVLAQYQPTHIFHFGAQSLPTLSWADPVTDLRI